MAKKLILICGPNGVGKSATARRLNERLLHSARVDSDWCRCVNQMEFTEELMSLNERNITSLLTNYLSCSYVWYVIFSYGFHGPRQQIFDRVMSDLARFAYEFVPVLLTCDVAENVRRMTQDGRDEARIERALAQSRPVYDGLPYTRIDTTHLTVDDVVDRICELL